MALTWSPEQEEILIDFYKKHEPLHNKNHPNYNYANKNKLLGELVRDLNKKSSDKKFKVDTVSTHWNELRNIYQKFKREVLKNELTKGKNNKTVVEPNWIWWRKMSSLFGGPTDNELNETLPSSPNVDATTTETVAKRNRRATVHHIRVETPEKVESPVKERRSRGTPTQRTPITPKLDRSPPVEVPEPVEISVAIKSRRRTAQVETPVATSTKASTSRRRTVYPRAKPNESPKKVQIPFFDNEEPAAQCKAASESWDLVTSTSSMPLIAPVPPVKKTKELNLSFSVTPPASSLSLDTLAGRKKRKTAAPGDDQQDAVTPMDTDQNSSPQTGTDECSSTAMFVESRLRACSGIKRQRIIFKIHEMFYAEEIYSSKYD